MLATTFQASSLTVHRRSTTGASLARPPLGLPTRTVIAVKRRGRAAGPAVRAADASVNVAAVEEHAPAKTLKLEPGVCIVTGASRGIGKATALALAEAGCKVAVNYVGSEESAQKVADQINKLGGEGMVVKCDTSKPEEIQRMFDEVVAKWGTVDVLVNNAGITRDTLMMKMKPEQWQEVMDVNLSGVFYCTQAATKIMGKKKKGRIINLGSVVGLIGNAGQANYSAAKGGVIAMTKTVAREYAARGITCNAIAPGFIDTAMTAKIDPKYKEEMIKGIPLGRMGQPEEVAGLIRYLALDPSAAYITGTCISINGGMAM